MASEFRRDTEADGQHGAASLSGILRKLLTTADQRAAIEQACEEACLLLRCDVFIACVVDERTGRLRLEACGGIEPGAARALEDLELTESLCGRAVLDGGHVVAENLRETPDAHCAPLQACGVLAYACQPLRASGGRAFGALGFGTSDRLAFSDRDLALIADLADLVSVVIMRGRMERGVQESEARFRALMQASSDVVYRMSPDWSEMQFLAGRNFIADAETSDSWLEKYIPREDQPRVVAVIEEAVRSKGIFQLEHRIRRVDGSIGRTFSRAIPICDADSNVVEWFGMAVDITDQKETRDALAATARRLALAASAARVGMFEWNLATDCVLWTEQHAPLLGLREWPATASVPAPVMATTEHHYRDWAGRVHPDDLPRVEAELRRCRDEHAPYEAEYRVVWPDGSVHWLVGRGLFQYDAAGVARSMLGTAMDITDRKQAENALVELNATLERRIAERTMELERSRRRSAAIVEAAFDAIVTIGRGGAIETCNPAAGRMFGYAEEELVGQNLDVLLPELRNTEAGSGRDVAGGRDLWLALGKTSQHSARRKDGTRFPVNLSFGEVPDPELGVCILRDVTEQRALQREILRISTLEQRRIGQELHDGPLQELAGIGLLAESLSDELRESRGPGCELAARVASEVAAVNRGIRQLAEGLVPVAVSADGLVRALRGLARTTQRRHGLHCTFSLVGAAPRVDDDVASHLYRIAREAVANAVKHAGAHDIQIRLEHRRDAIHLEVLDDGVGVQSGSMESGRLGLRTMRHRCTLMGGKFVIGTQARGGTRISCAIPLPEPGE